MRRITTLFFLFLFFFIQPVSAQIDLNSLTAPELKINLQPEFPRPGQSIVATLEDYSGEHYGSSITWVLDGSEIPDAKNQRQTQLVADSTGKTQTIQVILTNSIGKRNVIEAVIKPIYLDIVIEPQTHVPSFYLGRSLPSIGSVVNATALISNENLNQQTEFIYTWRINREVINGGPLRGGNQVSFTVPRGDSSVLALQVTNRAGDTIGSYSTLIPSVAPKIHFHEVSALFGINQLPISNTFPVIGNTATIQAVPYYLDSRTYNNPDIKEWKIDRVVSNNTSGNPYEVTLQRTGSNGASTLNFHVRDMEQVLQGAEANVRVNF